MKSMHIICSIKNLKHDYEHLQWIRLFLLSNDYHLSEDWISHSLNIRNAKPYFQPSPNFDYMKVATESINKSNKVIFIISTPSTFTTTMLRYALYRDKECIVVHKSKAALDVIEKDKLHLVRSLSFGNYQKMFKEVL